jgi:hypothetical protein
LDPIEALSLLFRFASSGKKNSVLQFVVSTEIKNDGNSLIIACDPP